MMAVKLTSDRPFWRLKMNVHYFDETGRKITYNLNDDQESIIAVAQTLVKAPIDIDYLYGDLGVFCLETFEWY
jgi:hypothetical protein